jgi:hypothetical protein
MHNPHGYHYVVQEGRPVVMNLRFALAVALFHEMVSADPTKKCGVFSGDNSLYWHFGEP